MTEEEKLPVGDGGEDTREDKAHEAEAEPEAETKQEPKTEPEAKAESEAVAETEPKETAEAETEAKAETETVAVSEPVAETETKQEAESEPEPEEKNESDDEAEAEAEPAGGVKAAFSRVFNAVLTVVMVGLLGFMIYATLAASRGKIVSVFGKSLLTVVTGSMEPTLHVGDFIFIEKTDPAQLKEGDIIAFYSEQSDIFGMLVTHRIAEAAEDGFVTRGDANPVDDSVHVRPERIVGKYTGKARLFRWASSFGETRKLLLLIVMVCATVAAFYEVRTIGRLKHTLDEEKQAAEEERERLIREAIDREKERLEKEGFKKSE